MKKTDAEQLFSHLQRHAQELGETPSADRLAAVLELCKALRGNKLADAFKTLPTLQVSAAENDGPLAADCAKTLSTYAALIQIVGKAPVAVALAEAAGVLQACGDVTLDQLSAAAQSVPAPATRGRAIPVRPVNETLVAHYNKTLEQALGDDIGFQEVIGRLERDETATVEDLIALAKRFAASSTKTKAAALKKIAARHASLMSSRARSEATGGRVAG